MLRVYFCLVLFCFKPVHLVHNTRGRKIVDPQLLLKAKKLVDRGLTRSSFCMALNDNSIS